MSVKIYTHADCIPRFKRITIEEIGVIHLIESPAVRLETSVLFFDVYTQTYKILKSRLPYVPRGFIASKAFFVENNIIESLALDKVPDVFIEKLLVRSFSNLMEIHRKHLCQTKSKLLSFTTIGTS